MKTLINELLCSAAMAALLLFVAFAFFGII